MLTDELIINRYAEVTALVYRSDVLDFFIHNYSFTKDTNGMPNSRKKENEILGSHLLLQNYAPPFEELKSSISVHAGIE